MKAYVKAKLIEIFVIEPIWALGLVEFRGLERTMVVFSYEIERVQANIPWCFRAVCLLRFVLLPLKIVF